MTRQKNKYSKNYYYKIQIYHKRFDTLIKTLSGHQVSLTNKGFYLKYFVNFKVIKYRINFYPLFKKNCTQT